MLESPLVLAQESEWSGIDVKVGSEFTAGAGVGLDFMLQSVFSRRLSQQWNHRWSGCGGSAGVGAAAGAKVGTGITGGT